MTALKQILHGHVEVLFPICRSITGEGLRQTLRYIQNFIPIQIHEVPSGTEVLDWVIPDEWTVRGASIRTLEGEVIVDFAWNNLHLVQYSQPMDAVVPRDELDLHLYSLPDQPDLIPYRTAYYNHSWGFCLAHNTRKKLTDPAYRVVIDTTLEPGSLSYGELRLAGQSEEEVLLSVHSCHPSLANDNLSAIAVAIEVARQMAGHPHRLSYRFLFAPGTIGAITWLNFNPGAVSKIRHGLVLTCLGDDAPPSYKRSRRGDAMIDRYAEYILRGQRHEDRLLPFEPTGYDERQYCSPGFNLPIGRLTRSPGGTFSEYHTSADNPTFVKPEALEDSLTVVLRMIDMIERDRIWLNRFPRGEPQLGRRGLYPLKDNASFDQLALMWVLNLSDGTHSVLEIAERSGKTFEAIAAAAAVLAEAGMLEPASHP